MSRLGLQQESAIADTSLVAGTSDQSLVSGLLFSSRLLHLQARSEDFSLLRLLKWEA